MTAVGGHRAASDPSARTDVMSMPGPAGWNPRAVPPAGLGPSAVTPGPYPPNPQYAQLPPGSGMRWGWLALGLVGAVLAVVTLVAFAGAQAKRDVTGTVTVYSMSGYVSPGASCENSSYQGTPVSLYNADNRLVGSASLTGYGTARNTWNTYAYSGYADSCEFSFTAGDVSMSSDYYRIVVGSGQNQGVSFSRAQLESGSAGVTLGH